MTAGARFTALLLILCLLAFSQASRAQGGPPLITDDPGTPGDGHWELNLAAGWWEGNSQSGILSAPYADINYGWGEHLQLKFEAGGAFLRQSGHLTDSGMGSGSPGIKYRFLDEDKCGVAVSTYP